uniref:Sulfotransferase n=1 Tax=Chrysolophus pictus TaxID=9089 RepID=A0A8C3KXQ1_CHRPC
METLDRIPWVEFNIKNMDFASLPLPRVFATHLPYYLTPKDLRNKKGRVIYVARNPKDVLVSYYHFSKFIRTLEKIPDFNIFMERFLAGKGRIFFLLKNLNPTPRPQTEPGLIVVINISHPESSAILACNQSWSDCLSLALLSD